MYSELGLDAPSGSSLNAARSCSTDCALMARSSLGYPPPLLLILGGRTWLVADCRSAEEEGGVPDRCGVVARGVRAGAVGDSAASEAMLAQTILAPHC